MEIVSWLGRMGQNFEDYSGFQPKTTPKCKCDRDMANTVQTCGSREAASNKNCREWLLLVFIVFTFTFGIGFVTVVWTTQFHNLDKVKKFLELICDLKKSICWDFNY